MKDLKHLIYFENLLQEANNELVQKAIADGDKALGYNCYYLPEVLLNCGRAFSVRLRAPNTGSPAVSLSDMKKAMNEPEKSVRSALFALPGGSRTHCQRILFSARSAQTT